MSVLPEAFEVIELSGLSRKDMHDKAAEVHEHPRAAAMALAGEHRLARLVHRLFDRVAERLDVRGAGGGAD